MGTETVKAALILFTDDHLSSPKYFKVYCQIHRNSNQIMFTINVISYYMNYPV